MEHWKVEYELPVAGQLKLDFKEGRISSEDISLLKSWVREIEELGPESIQKRRLWDDHPLEREWEGYRSSCFSLKGRIIYRIENEKVIVRVVRIPTEHDYGKGKNK